MFVFAFNNKEGNDQVSVDSSKQYFLPRVKIENCNIKIDGKNFYNQPINDSIKQYEKLLYSWKKTMLEFAKWTTNVL